MEQSHVSDRPYKELCNLVLQRTPSSRSTTFPLRSSYLDHWRRLLGLFVFQPALGSIQEVTERLEIDFVNYDVPSQCSFVLHSGKGKRWARQTFVYAETDCAGAFNAVGEQATSIMPRALDPHISRFEDIGCPRYRLTENIDLLASPFLPFSFLCHLDHLYIAGLRPLNSPRHVRRLCCVCWRQPSRAETFQRRACKRTWWWLIPPSSDIASGGAVFPSPEHRRPLPAPVPPPRHRGPYCWNRSLTVACCPDRHS